MIRVEHLKKHYGKFTAVDGISFDVKQGEIYALLGPNGSGKTTTMKSIVGLVIPDSGRIIVNGIDAYLNPKESRRSISYLPQRVLFPENLTAYEVILFHARLRKLSKQQIDEAIDKSRFDGFTNKLVTEFSGGMIQRLGLAVVSLADAPVLLLDEPTASLDPQGVKRFREFVLEQKEQGKTIIFSTHLLQEAELLADRVGIFVSGKLVTEESIADLKSAFLQSKTIEDMYIHYVETHRGEE